MTSPLYTWEDATKLSVKATKRLLIFLLLGHLNNDVLPCLL